MLLCQAVKLALLLHASQFVASLRCVYDVTCSPVRLAATRTVQVKCENHSAHTGPLQPSVAHHMPKAWDYLVPGAHMRDARRFHHLLVCEPECPPPTIRLPHSLCEAPSRRNPLSRGQSSMAHLIGERVIRQFHLVPP